MGRLTDDTARLVEEIHASREDRWRLLRDLKHATAEMKRAVARVRRSFAADLAGARAAWLGARAPVSSRAGVPETAAPRGRGGEDVLREAKEERRRLEAERQARDEAQMARKAGRRHRPR